MYVYIYICIYIYIYIYITKPEILDYFITVYWLLDRYLELVFPSQRHTQLPILEKKASYMTLAGPLLEYYVL